MKDVKTFPKYLGKLMRSGGTTPAHPIPPDQKEQISTVAEDAHIAEKIETRLGVGLTELDTDTFERLLKNVAASNTDLLKKVPSGEDSELSAIMGLIDDAKQWRTSGQEHENTACIKNPAEEVIIEKPPPVIVKKLPQRINMTESVCGNPITDYDQIYATNGDMAQNGDPSPDIDPVSRMEMGQSILSPAFDDVDLNKINGPRFKRCDEPEQQHFLREKGLHEFTNKTILGPGSKGEFVSFNQSMAPVIACDIGVLNPLTAANFHVFQTCTPNGRLLPAIPRKFFPPNDNASKPKSLGMPAVHRPPVTILISSSAPSLLTTTLTDSQAQNLYSPTKNSTITPPSLVEAEGVPVEIQNQNNKDMKKNGEAVSLNEVVELEVVNNGADEIEMANNEEKENKADTVIDKDKQARQKKNKKNKEKKKAAKKIEMMNLNEEQKEPNENEKTASVVPTEENSKNNRSMKTVGVASTQQEEKVPHNASNRRSIGSAFGGKSKKTDKSVTSEYTVGELGSGANLADVLKDLGITDVSELNENSKKKGKKGNNNAATNNNNNNNTVNNSKKNKQQNQKKQEKKESARSPPFDNEVISIDEGIEKSKKSQKGGKKMDEIAVAASITKRSSSGVGQQSEEDDDQSYVSAQENLGGSNSRLSTPPAEFVDARQSRDEVNDNVMLDPNNYRDDDDVESLAKQLQQEEDEFITVGKNKKKNRKQSTVQDNVSASSTASSSSPPNRRNNQPDAHAHVPTASSISSSANSQPQHSQPQRNNNNRPVAHPTTLGDFMESTKKDTHKNIKHKKIGGSSVPQKKQPSFDEPNPSSPAFVDALETPISINTAPLFSYADAAKKSSGENTPAHEMSPVPPSATSSTTSSVKNPVIPSTLQTGTMAEEIQKIPANFSSHADLSSSKPISTSVSGAVQLPPSTVTTASDISFGYEETPEDRRKRQQKVATVPPQKPQKPTRMNGVDLLKSFVKDASNGLQKETDLQEMPKNGVRESSILATEILSLWKTRWNEFNNTGPKPVVYKPSPMK